MERDKFCLRWNDFAENFTSAFRELREHTAFFDLTLACEDEEIKVHKVILATCSSFFRNILQRHPQQHTLLYLKGVKYSDLQAVITFMYHGEVNVAQEDLSSFLAVAADLKIKGLTENQKATPAARKHSAPPSICPPIVRTTPKTNHAPSLLEHSSHTVPHSENDLHEVSVKSEPTDQVKLACLEQDSIISTPEDDLDLCISYEDDDYQNQDQQQQLSFHRSVAEDLETDSSKGQLDMDMDSLMSDTGSGTMCLLCYKVLAYRHDARRHIRMKHSGDNTGITCDICGKKSKHRWSHADHMRQKHGQYSNKHR